MLITTKYIKNLGAELLVQFVEFSKFSKVLLEWCKILYKLRNCCQSFRNSANGSNACMIIALLAGHAISGAGDLLNELTNNTINTDILSSVVGCTDIGNTFYDTNNLNGYLDILYKR